MIMKYMIFHIDVFKMKCSDVLLVKRILLGIIMLKIVIIKTIISCSDFMSKYQKINLFKIDVQDYGWVATLSTFSTLSETFMSNLKSL